MRPFSDLMNFLILTTLDHDTLCQIREDCVDPSRSHREAAAENTDDAVSRFDELLCGMMDTATDKDQKEQPDTEEDHLSNCWKAQPQSVYSKFSTVRSNSSTTQPSTLSRITDSNTSPAGVAMQLIGTYLLDKAHKQLQALEEAVKDQKAKWEKEAKTRTKERDEAE
eukprot:9978405-Ditylum_brightwellii.AAC.1